MSNQEKVEKLSREFLSLSEEGKQYALAIVDALAYATEFAKAPQPPDDLQKEKSA